jgi:hypothetical protein
VNTIIVSTWARTGWNVIRPNVLIDATATRDVTAWQQLRGRSMRAMRTWTNDCYRLVLLLMGSRPMGLEGADGLPPDVADAYEDVVQHSGGTPADLDDAMEAVLASAGIEWPAAGRDGHRVSALDPEQRQELDALTADIPAGRTQIQATEPARESRNRKLIQRGTAAGAGASMAFTAALVTAAGGSPVVGLVVVPVIGSFVAVLLAGLLTLLSWVLDKGSSRRLSQGPPPGQSRQLQVSWMPGKRYEGSTA